MNSTFFQFLDSFRSKKFDKNPEKTSIHSKNDTFFPKPTKGATIRLYWTNKIAKSQKFCDKIKKKWSKHEMEENNKNVLRNPTKKHKKRIKKIKNRKKISNVFFQTWKIYKAHDHSIIFNEKNC